MISFFYNTRFTLCVILQKEKGREKLSKNIPDWENNINFLNDDYI